MKRLKVLLIVLAFFILLPTSYAKEKVTVYIFRKQNEPISQSAVDYFNKLKKTDTGKYFNYVEYEVWDTNWNENNYYRKIADKVAEKFKEEVTGSPYIIIGSNYSLPTFTEEHEAEIQNVIVESYLDNDYEDIVEKVINEIKESRKYDVIIISGISVVLIGIISSLIIFSRKDN